MKTEQFFLLNNSCNEIKLKKIYRQPYQMPTDCMRLPAKNFACVHGGIFRNYSAHCHSERSPAHYECAGRSRRILKTRFLDSLRSLGMT